MLGPGHRFQPLLLHFFLAAGALTECVIANALQRFVDLIQHIAVRAGLPEQEFLGVGVGCLVRQVDGRIVVRLPPFLFRTRDGLHQLISPRQ